MAFALCEAQLSSYPEIAYVPEINFESGRTLRRGTGHAVARMLEVELAVDPKLILPDVRLISAYSQDEQTPANFAADKDFLIIEGGRQVGSVTIATDEAARECWIDNLTLDAADEDIASSVHNEAIKESLLAGYSFRTCDTTVSPGTKRIWDVLAAVGAANVVEPFVPVEGGQFAGHYRVNVIR
jgi:hypothetical protein